MQPATMYTRDRCITGIHGMDEILRGGIPYGSTVLAAGTCGSGKTTLGMEFLVRGALAGEACAHFTATEPSVKLLENIRQYAFFDMNMIDSGLINVFDMDVLYSWLGLDKASFDLDDVHALIKAIVDIVNTIGVTRLVIDSVTTLCYKIKSEQLIRDFLFTLGKKLATLGCTTILISEITSATENAHWSSFGVEEAIADGIIVMGDVERMGHLLRFLQVVKMRGTAHSRAKHAIELTPLGVMLTPMLKWGAVSDKTNIDGCLKMYELDQRIAEQLTEVSLNSSIQVRCGNSNAFMVTASTMIPLMQMFEMGGVYICATRGAVEIIEAFEAIGVDVSNIQFVDLVSSGILGGTDVPYNNITFVDSPIMLESVLLRTLYILRIANTERNFVLIDSVNALAIYNEERMLAEYLHTFINTFRQREVLSVILNIPDQVPPTVLSNLDLYCTDLIDRGQVVIH